MTGTASSPAKTRAQKAEDRAAKTRIKRNERDLKRLDEIEKQLDELPKPPRGSKAAARRNRLEQEIINKRENLAIMNDHLRDMIKTNDEDKRDGLRDIVNEETEAFRNTSNLGDGKVDDPVSPCKRISEDLWEVVKVTPNRDRKQYVNIDSRIRPRPKPIKHHGREIVIKAQISPPKKNKVVHWRLHEDANNRKLHYSQGGDPSATPPVPHPQLPASHRASLSANTSVTNSKGIATIKLKLGLYGGDKFQVSAYRDPPDPGPTPEPKSGAANHSSILEVWKKTLVWPSPDEETRRRSLDHPSKFTHAGTTRVRKVFCRARRFR